MTIKTKYHDYDDDHPHQDPPPPQYHHIIMIIIIITITVTITIAITVTIIITIVITGIIYLLINIIPIHPGTIWPLSWLPPWLLLISASMIQLNPIIFVVMEHQTYPTSNQFLPWTFLREAWKSSFVDGASKEIPGTEITAIVQHDLWLDSGTAAKW